MPFMQIKAEFWSRRLVLTVVSVKLSATVDFDVECKYKRMCGKIQRILHYKNCAETKQKFYKTMTDDTIGIVHGSFR